MRCAFCIIPSTRGRQRSRPASEVVGDVAALTAGGFAEIVVTGVQISSYRDGRTGLFELVQSPARRDRRAAIATHVDRALAVRPPPARPVCRRPPVPALPPVAAERLRRHPAAHAAPLRRRGLRPTGRGDPRRRARRRADHRRDRRLSRARPKKSSPTAWPSADASASPGCTRSRSRRDPARRRRPCRARYRTPFKRQRMTALLEVAHRGRRRFERRQIGTRTEALWERRREDRWLGTTDNYLCVVTPGGADGVWPQIAAAGGHRRRNRRRPARHATGGADRRRRLRGGHGDPDRRTAADPEEGRSPRVWRAPSARSAADETEFVWLEARHARATHTGGRPEIEERRENTLLVRVIDRGRVGSHRTGAVTPGDLDNAVRAAVAQSRARQPVPGLPHLPPDEGSPPRLPRLHDEAISRLDARGVDRLIGRLRRRSEQARLRWTDARVAVFSSRGLRRGVSVTAIELAVRAGDGPGCGLAVDAARSLEALRVESVFDRARHRRGGDDLGERPPGAGCRGPVARGRRRPDASCSTARRSPPRPTTKAARCCASTLACRSSIAPSICATTPPTRPACRFRSTSRARPSGRSS